MYLISEGQVALIVRMARHGASDAEIREETGVNAETISTVLLGEHPHQTGVMRCDGPRYLPTPEQIERECHRLRKARGDTEAAHWTPPLIRLLEITG